MQTCRRDRAYCSNLRCRLQVSEGKFEDAIYTLQSGFALARQLGDADTLIQDLVGIAIAAIMCGRVEEMIQQPGSPDLFWALTDLPSPLVDIRRAIRVEMNTFHRSFPQLRELERDAGKKPLSVKEVEKLIDDFVGDWMKLTGDKASPWQGRAAMSMVALKVYPDAKTYLAEKGFSKEEIEALPALQAVIVYYLDQYNQVRDDTVKWLNAPPWQARPQLDQVARDMRKTSQDGIGNPIITLLMPAISKVYDAYMRTDGIVGRLRCAEALRLYATSHGGKAPVKFTDISNLPLPINPYTGKGYDEFYQFKDGKGVLDVPAPGPMPKSFGRRYEIGK